MKILIFLPWFCIREEKGSFAEPVDLYVVVCLSVKGVAMVVKGNDINHATKCCHERCLL